MVVFQLAKLAASGTQEIMSHTVIPTSRCVQLHKFTLSCFCQFPISLKCVHKTLRTLC
jgi:hypothetical protein